MTRKKASSAVADPPETDAEVNTEPTNTDEQENPLAPADEPEDGESTEASNTEDQPDADAPADDPEPADDAEPESAGPPPPVAFGLADESYRCKVLKVGRQPAKAALSLELAVRPGNVADTRLRNMLFVEVFNEDGEAVYYPRPGDKVTDSDKENGYDLVLSLLDKPEAPMELCPGGLKLASAKSEMQGDGNPVASLELHATDLPRKVAAGFLAKDAEGLPVDEDWYGNQFDLRFRYRPVPESTGKPAGAQDGKASPLTPLDMFLASQGRGIERLGEITPDMADELPVDTRLFIVTSDGGAAIELTKLWDSDLVHDIWRQTVEPGEERVSQNWRWIMENLGETERFWLEHSDPSELPEWAQKLVPPAAPAKLRLQDITEVMAAELEAGTVLTIHLPDDDGEASIVQLGLHDADDGEGCYWQDLSEDGEPFSWLEIVDQYGDDAESFSFNIGGLRCPEWLTEDLIAPVGATGAAAQHLGSIAPGDLSRLALYDALAVGAVLFWEDERGDTIPFIKVESTEDGFCWKKQNGALGDTAEMLELLQAGLTLSITAYPGGYTELPSWAKSYADLSTCVDNSKGGE